MLTANYLILQASERAYKFVKISDDGFISAQRSALFSLLYVFFDV